MAPLVQPCHVLLWQWLRGPRGVWAGARPFRCEAQQDLVIWWDLAKRADVFADAAGVWDIGGQRWLPVNKHDPRVRPGSRGVVVGWEVTGTPLVGPGVPPVILATPGVSISGHNQRDNWTYGLLQAIKRGITQAPWIIEGDDRKLYVAPTGYLWLPFKGNGNTLTPVPAGGAGGVAAGDIIAYLQTGGRGDSLVNQIPQLVASGQLASLLRAMDKERHSGGFFAKMFSNPLTIMSLVVAVVGFVTVVASLGAVLASMGVVEVGAVAGEAAAVTVGELASFGATEAALGAAEAGLTGVEIAATYEAAIMETLLSGIELPAGITGGELTGLAQAEAALGDLQALGVPDLISTGVADASVVAPEGASPGVFVSGENFYPSVGLEGVPSDISGAMVNVAPVDTPTQGMFIDMASQEISPGIAQPTGTFAETDLGKMVSTFREWSDPVNLLTKDLPPLQKGLIDTGRSAAELANKVRGIVDPNTPPFTGPLIRSGSTGQVYEVTTGTLIPADAGGTTVTLPGRLPVPVAEIPTDTSLLTQGGSGSGGGGGGTGGVPYVRSDTTGYVYDVVTGDRLSVTNGTVTLPSGQTVPLASIPLESAVTATGGGGTTPFLEAVQAQAGLNPLVALGLAGLAVLLLSRRR